MRANIEGRIARGGSGERRTMYARQIKELRRKMASVARIEEVWRYFMDHFGDSEAFLKLGESMSDPNHPLLAVVAQAGNTVFTRNGIPARIPDAIQIDDCALISVPEYRLIHGSMLLEGYPTTLLYLEDIQMGALYLFLRPNRGEYVRFSLAKAPTLPSHYN